MTWGARPQVLWADNRRRCNIGDARGLRGGGAPQQGRRGYGVYMYTRVPVHPTEWHRHPVLGSLLG